MYLQESITEPFITLQNLDGADKVVEFIERTLQEVYEAPPVRFERTTIGLEVQKSSVSPVYRAPWCLPTPIYRG